MHIRNQIVDLSVHIIQGSKFARKQLVLCWVIHISAHRYELGMRLTPTATHIHSIYTTDGPFLQITQLISVVEFDTS